MASKQLVGRVWFAGTALVVAVGIILQLVVTGGSAGNGVGFYQENPERVLNVLVFFTIQSNLLLGATTLLLAIRPERTSLLFRTLRLNGVLGIAVTGIVYHLVLADLDDLSGGAAVANLLLHTATPILGVLGWLIFGPRGQTDERAAAWSVVFPVVWLVFTLIRGEFTEFYPYPFVDVNEHGMPTVLLNCLLIAVLLLGLAVGAALLDRRIRVDRATRP
ncbi:Pr6Pr family membrane protein [Kribbella sp. NBC_01245]|uniref:Pr6Pr family membrane protein n=1 Tax=Kribbella sp. NBC_01245 TaxID=2903578 RepID=UPI002E2DECFE|nr:Pr6Pr family membrane protein [Kribbella sp. NBC_01245]